ncbi:hypothetical protein Mapa_009666 [Marchantia paleacea]|nr:hypothetical protein Mapa_009666 [Marchantia paleacea]
MQGTRCFTISLMQYQISWMPILLHPEVKIRTATNSCTSQIDLRLTLMNVPQVNTNKSGPNFAGRQNLDFSLLAIFTSRANICSSKKSCT